jgi:hypothetical protein
MNYLAQGLNNGFQSGFGAMSEKKRDKRQMEAQMVRDAQVLEAQKTLQNERAVQAAARDFENNTFNASENDKNRSFRAQEADKANAFKASLYYDEQSRREEQAITERARADLAPQSKGEGTVPTAKIRQNIGDGAFAESEIPQTDLEKTVGGMRASGYKSPYADEIAGLQAGTAKQQSEIVGQNQKKLIRLQALELQDQVRKGVLTQEQADARAEQLMGGR